MCIGGVCLRRPSTGVVPPLMLSSAWVFALVGALEGSLKGLMKAYIALLTLGLATQDAKINPACTDAKIQNFPSWIINGKVAEGDQTFDQLEKLLLQ